MRSEAFAWWQPRYAEHGIPTFPVNAARKTPAVRGYQRVGLRGSAALAAKRPDADAFGFCPGKHSKITVLDVDTPDERVLADALQRHGPTRVRSGSGNYQAWYRHGGEGRQVRPDPQKPIDILGAGYVIAPQSRGARGYYQIVEGTLDDLDRLPVMRAATEALRAKPLPRLREGDGRNPALFDRARHLALRATTEEELLGMVSEANQAFAEPLDVGEVQRVTSSVWKYKQEGRLMVSGGEAAAVVFNSDMAHLWDAPTAFVLLMRLRLAHGWRNGAPFALANAMAESMGVAVNTFRTARDLLIERQFIEMVHPGGKRPKDPPIVRLL